MISAKIIADSISEDEDRITTFELEYPRFIHSELMTHRVFSRNAASSRAIPIDKMMEQVLTAPAMPVEWGLNQAGMQAGENHKYPTTCEISWGNAAERAVISARELQSLGLHKQIVNRVLEPFQMMKTIVTATEFDNFFWLRCHEDAQPEIHVLADKMYELYKDSVPNLLQPGEWHLPYIDLIRSPHGLAMYYLKGNPNAINLEEAQKVSSSCCAQVSYRRLDDSLDKALKIYDQLVTMTPVHASPFEHIATPMEETEHPLEALMEVLGVTHLDSNLKLWSGNFKGWIQYRQLIKGNVCNNYED